MSGDIHPDDDADFLDEDFVVDDLGRARELKDLFDESAPELDDCEPSPGAGLAGAEQDQLFTDHTANLGGEPAWQGDGFDEQGASGWNGEQLDLESVGVPVARERDAEELDAAAFDEVRDSFTAELDSLLQSEEEFALDSEAELEVIGGDSDDGISEFEQSGPFVLDDGEGLWSDEHGATAAEPALAGGSAAKPSRAGAEAEFDGEFEDDDDDDSLFDVPDTVAAANQPYEPVFAAGDLGREIDEQDGSTPSSLDDDAGDALLEELPLYDAAGGNEDLEEGWEPLPGQSMDALAEVEEVQRSDEELLEEAQSCTAPNYAPVDVDDPDLEDVEGHDIYDDGEDEAVVIGGPGSRRGRWAGVVGSLLAASVILGGGALVVAKPELFGLRIEPQRVERVELPRPRIEFAVGEPPRPVSQAMVPAAIDPAGGEAQPAEPSAAESQPVATPPVATEAEPQATDGQPAAPHAGDPQPVDPQPVDPQLLEPQATDPQSSASPAVTVPVVAAAQPVVQAVEPSPMAQAWPEDLGAVAAPDQPAAVTEPGALARFGDGLLVGELGDAQARPSRAIDGVLPGSRAFAQLHNGNYFIGSVKQVAEQSVTLRVEDGGEVTLATAEIAQLTELGSRDFDELQKATRGFVRLTNNNRLVGGILSRIADDHVVLEFRKNRVILPRSAVGEIVSGESDRAVRLDTTSEEDGWVRRVVERELGTGMPAIDPDQRPESAPRGAPPK